MRVCVCVMLVFPSAVEPLASQSIQLQSYPPLSSRLHLSYARARSCSQPGRRTRVHVKRTFNFCMFAGRRGEHRGQGKSLSRRVSLSTMDCLFDFNKACMNEKSNHLTNVSATRADKEGRVEGEREVKRGRGVGFSLSRGRPFSSAEQCQAVRGVQNRNNHHSLSLSLFVSAPQRFCIFSNNFTERK